MKTVTAVTAQQKNKKRVNLYRDGEYFCSLDLFTVISERLKAGDTVDEARIREIADKSEYSSALDKALSYISKSMHTKAQIIKYLKGKDYQGRTIAKVIDKLEEYGYVDDAAFARKYFAEKSGASGVKKIAYELKLKGVDEKTIDGLSEDFSDQTDACFLIAKKYLKGAVPDYQLRQKCYRYLLNKGFDYETAKSAVEKLSDEDSFS
ncbi:MAG: RecX family transcriptional regulator [Clostridia bacterium]|nr:RecX family transcriptional regulator [Clostridia bacterium]